MATRTVRARVPFRVIAACTTRATNGAAGKRPPEGERLDSLVRRRVATAASLAYAELNRERSETNLNVLLCSPGGTDGLLVLWNMARKTVEVNISRRGTRNADV